MATHHQLHIGKLEKNFPLGGKEIEWQATTMEKIFAIFTVYASEIGLLSRMYKELLKSIEEI